MVLLTTEQTMPINSNVQLKNIFEEKDAVNHTLTNSTNSTNTTVLFHPRKEILLPHSHTHCFRNNLMCGLRTSTLTHTQARAHPHMRLAPNYSFGFSSAQRCVWRRTCAHVWLGACVCALPKRFNTFRTFPASSSSSPRAHPTRTLLILSAVYIIPAHTPVAAAALFALTFLCSLFLPPVYYAHCVCVCMHTRFCYRHWLTVGRRAGL